MLLPAAGGSGGAEAEQQQEEEGEGVKQQVALDRKRQRGLSEEVQSAKLECLTVDGEPVLTLVDLCSAIPIMQQPRGQFKEDPHMQEATFKMLKAMADELKWDVGLADTHSTAEQFQNPTGRPDAVAMDSKLTTRGSRRQWAMVVVPFEFKLGDAASVLDEGAGQLAERSCAIFSAQMDRSLVVAVLLTMDSVEVGCEAMCGP